MSTALTAYFAGEKSVAMMLALIGLGVFVAAALLLPARTAIGPGAGHRRESIAALAPTHVVATRDVDSEATIWVDGEALVSEARSGSFELWSGSHVLAIGNEVDLTRGYAGAIHLAAIYERALDATEIATNRDAGY